MEPEPVYPNLLLSYHFYKKADLDEMIPACFAQPYPQIFADSGAFSAMTTGAQVNIIDYMAWIKRWQHWFVTYSNFDVVGDANATAVNQSIMENAGYAPLPVFHASNEWKPLEDLLAAGYTYIALGGLVPLAVFSKTRMRYLIKAFQMAAGKAVFHGYGITAWKPMSELPWYSVDSSTWASGFMWGRLHLFDRRRGVFENPALSSIKECYRSKHLFEEYGFDWRDFADREKNKVMNGECLERLCALGVLSFMVAEKYLRNKFGGIQIPGAQQREGMRLYMVNIRKDMETSFGKKHAVPEGIRVYLASPSGKTQWNAIKNGIARGKALT